MSNLLRDIFAAEEPMYKGTLSFETAEDRSNFLNALKLLEEEERPIKIRGVKEFETYLETSLGKNVFDKSIGKIVQFYIAPSTEKRPYSVDTDYGKYTFDFEQFKKSKGVVVTRTNENGVLIIKITATYTKETFDFTYRINHTKADSIETIVKSYNALRMLIQRFCPATAGGDTKHADILRSLNELEQYWGRVWELEEKLNIHFDPSEIEGAQKEMVNLETLYLLLVKKLPIRKKIGNFNISMDYEERHQNNEYSVGQQMGIFTNEMKTFTVFGNEIKVYTDNYIFNAVIDSIENDKQEEKFIVNYSGSETKPLYCVYLGYTSPEFLADNPDFNIAQRELADAKTFNGLMDEFGYSSLRIRD